LRVVVSEFVSQEQARALGNWSGSGKRGGRVGALVDRLSYEC
jgi:hypothetical protein